MASKTGEPRLRLPARRNLRWLAAGLVAVCVGGLGGAGLYLKLTDAKPVLIATKTIARGTQLAASDFAVVNVTEVPGMRTVPADELELVTGKQAVIDMAEGTFLTPQSFGRLDLAPGTVRVGMKLAPGRLPNHPLSTGSSVLLISVPSQLELPTAGTPRAQIFRAVIARSPQEAADGANFLLDLAVPTESAATVVGLAALDQLALVAD